MARASKAPVLRTLRYETRDEKGNEIVREIPISERKVTPHDGPCAMCGRRTGRGVLVKDAVSSNFTDWACFSEGEPVVCEHCAQLFSVYPYSYIYEPDSGDIELLNVRQIEDAILGLGERTKPYLCVISVSQKKHLFYRAQINGGSSGFFAVNLESETIHTTTERQKNLFALVKHLAVLGTPKSAVAEGVITSATSELLGTYTSMILYNVLHRELTQSREIQIALHAAQKPEDADAQDTLERLRELLDTMEEMR